MKTKIKVLLGVIVLVVIAAGVYFTNPKGQKGLVKVRLRRLPDLVAASLAVSPPTGATGLTAGLTATISVKITNGGTASSGASTTKFKINGTAIATMSTGALATGSTEIETSSWTPTIEGSYIVEACADATSVITEVRETNNCKAMTVTVAAPPPLPPPTLPPPPPPVEPPPSLPALCNANQFTCASWSSCSAAGTQSGIDCTENRGAICTAPSSAERGCTQPPPPPPPPPARAPDCYPKQYTCAEWDACSASGLQTASECTAYPGISCMPPISVQRECTPPLPDLVIEDITIIDQNAYGVINFRVRVRNAGNAPVTSTESSLIYIIEDTIDSAGNIVLERGGSNVLRKCLSVDSIGWSSSCGTSFTIAPGEIITTSPFARSNNPNAGKLSGGGVGIRLTVDPLPGSVTESNETNNSLDFMVPSSYLTFRPTNLIVSNARVVSTDTDGLYANFAATVENLGTADITTPFQVSLFIDLGTSSPSLDPIRSAVGTIPVLVYTNNFIPGEDYAVDMTISELAGQSSRDVSMRWYGSGGIGVHTFSVCVNSAHQDVLNPTIYGWPLGSQSPTYNNNPRETNVFDNCSPIQEFFLTGPL